MSLTDRVPDLTTLELLEAIAERGSIGGAASAVGVSQQAVSQRLRAAERLVGAELVSRGRTGSRLTAQGELLLEWSRPILDGARRLRASLATLAESGAGPLRVAASQTISEYLLPGWLHRYARTGGGPVALGSGNSEQVLARLRAGEADLGLVETPDLPDGLARRALGEDRLVVVVGSEHPWAERRDPVTAAELAATPMILREAGSGTRDTLTRSLGAQGLRPAPPAAELATGSAIRAAVRSGLAPSVLSELAVADDLAEGSLLRVPAIGLDLTRPLTSVWVGRLHPDAEALLATTDVRAQD